MRQSPVITASLLFALWLGVALALGAHAASLFKCVDARGHVSYQSQACAAGSEQAWEREATPEAVRERPAPPPARATAEVPVGSRVIIRPSRRTAAGGGAGRKSASAACQRARAADAAYRAQPLGRVTHDGLRRHGDRLRAACG